MDYRANLKKIKILQDNLDRFKSIQDNKIFDFFYGIKTDCCLTDNNWAIMGIKIDLNELIEEDIDFINKAIYDHMGNLDNTQPITIVLFTEFPIAVWAYLVTLAEYTKYSLSIKTIEDVEKITSLLPLSHNLILTQRDYRVEED